MYWNLIEKQEVGIVCIQPPQEAFGRRLQETKISTGPPQTTASPDWQGPFPACGAYLPGSGSSGKDDSPGIAWVQGPGPATHSEALQPGQAAVTVVDGQLLFWVTVPSGGALARLGAWRLLRWPKYSGPWMEFRAPGFGVAQCQPWQLFEGEPVYVVSCTSSPLCCYCVPVRHKSVHT